VKQELAARAAGILALQGEEDVKVNTGTLIPD
jgi:hypothetical protein